MTESYKLSLLKDMLSITDTKRDGLLRAYLSAAKAEILNWRYSYSKNRPTDVPEEYEMVQVFAVVAGYSLEGAENHVSYSENGTSRAFKYSDMLEYIHAHVIPIAGCD